MTTYPLATLAAQVSATGISAPSYTDVLLSLQATYHGIYGSDVVLTPDTQDGQWLAAIAQAITDCNAAAIATYAGFSPASAQGVALSSVVKLNGLQRNVATNSTCIVTITGTAGTVITNGQVQDTAGNLWTLPASVTIGAGASVTVTATAVNVGAIAAAAHTLTKIATPTLGWLTVDNATAASPGAPVESDAALRLRQTISTALPASSPMDSVIAAVANTTGVTRVVGYDNATGVTDANGLPGHSLWIVAEGGSNTAVAQAIANTKTPGTGTYGAVSTAVTDPYGMVSTIKFDTPSYQRLVVNLSVHALTGYTSQMGTNMQAALAAYVASLSIGESVYLTQMIAAAINGSGNPSAFNLVSLGMAIYPATPAAADVVLTFKQAAQLALADITLSLV